MAKKRCKKKGKRRCLSSFNFSDPLSYKLYCFFNFDGRTCQEVLRQATAGVHPQTSVSESIAGYFQRFVFGPKFGGSYGTYYSVSLPDKGKFTFKNELIKDTDNKGDLTGEITLIWRGQLRNDGNTLTELQFMGKHAGNGATNNPFDFNCSHGGTPTPRCVRANAGFRIHQAPAALSFATPYTIGFYNGNEISTAGDWWKDGAFWGAASLSGSGSGRVTGGGQDLVIGYRPDDALIFRGMHERILIYTRKLTQLEHWQIHDDPNVVFSEQTYTDAITLAVGSFPKVFNSTVDFSMDFERADVFFQSEVVLESEFVAIESRGYIDSDVRFRSQFTNCVSSDIYNKDTGDFTRYRR